MKHSAERSEAYVPTNELTSQEDDYIYEVNRDVLESDQGMFIVTFQLPKIAAHYWWKTPSRAEMRYSGDKSPKRSPHLWVTEWGRLYDQAMGIIDTVYKDLEKEFPEEYLNSPNAWPSSIFRRNTKRTSGITCSMSR